MHGGRGNHRYTVEAGEDRHPHRSEWGGKSTVLKCLSGLVPSCRLGRSEFEGKTHLRLLPAERIADLGIIHTPGGAAGLSPGMTVLENLRRSGTYPWRTKASTRFEADLDRVFQLFPVFGNDRAQAGWSMSGREQQMLAIGRSLMSRPKILLLDEPSLGLAPLIIEPLPNHCYEINKEESVTILARRTERAHGAADGLSRVRHRERAHRPA